jgi:transcriptional regulator with XRE-family HTH domain
MTVDVGKRLSTIRKEKGLSQRGLAGRAGVTNSTISLIEQNKVSPSVGSLKKVLDGLPMSLGDFFTMGEEASQDEVVFRQDKQPDLGQGDIGFYLIGSGRRNRDMTVMREVLQAGADTGQDMLQHEGEEGGVVICGQLELTVGDKVQKLGPGDGYYFDSKQPHRFRNVGDGELVIVSANTPPSF